MQSLNSKRVFVHFQRTGASKDQGILSICSRFFYSEYFCGLSYKRDKRDIIIWSNNALIKGMSVNGGPILCRCNSLVILILNQEES